MHTPPRILDLFAGPGGWSEGIRTHLGLTDIGIEWDTAACQTRAAAGHTTIRADVAAYPTRHLAKLTHSLIVGLIASPPCTLFSSAGKGIGRLVLDVLADGIRRLFRGDDCRTEIRERILPVALAEQKKANTRRPTTKQWTAEKVLAAAQDDAYCAALVLEPARYLHDLTADGDPLEWVALEQVPSVEPLWQVYAAELRALGWSVWAGVLNAADYGVPQTRERAVLIGSRVRQMRPPEPTHSHLGDVHDLFGGYRAAWVTMADALDLPAELTVNTRGARRTSGGNDFSTGIPSWALTEKIRSWWILRQGARSNATRRRLDEPAGTIVAGHSRRDYQWLLVGDSAQERRAFTIPEAARLQSFPEAYPWIGSESRQFLQIANAVPPLLAAHIVSAATGLPMLTTAALQSAT